MLRNRLLVTPKSREKPLRALLALVMVSSVVKVLEEIMNSVSAGSRSRVASTKSVPSTLETNRKVIAAIAVVLERLVGHHRPQIGAADADVDDVADAACRCGRSTRRCGPDWRNRPSGRAPHGPRARRPRHQPGSIAPSARAAPRAGRPASPNVDLLASEHRIDPRAEPGLFGQLQQQIQRFVGDPVLRVVEVEFRRPRPSSARRVWGLEQRARADASGRSSENGRTGPSRQEAR